LDPAKHIEYGEFLNELSKRLVRKKKKNWISLFFLYCLSERSCSFKQILSYPDRINYLVKNAVEYFKSPWNTLKANAAAFTGYLMGNATPEARKFINPGLVSTALIALLKDKSPQVRKQCAEAMSLLHNY
jgi:hypothetical protein